jgi:hypothetical protein
MALQIKSQLVGCGRILWRGLKATVLRMLARASMAQGDTADVESGIGQSSASKTSAIYCLGALNS